MDNKDLIEYRRKLFDDALHQRKMERVPQTFNQGTWSILNSTTRLKDALNNTDHMLESITRQFLDEFPVDSMNAVGTLYCVPTDLVDGLGESFYDIDEEKGMISIGDLDFMEDDEYPSLIANYPKFVWETLLPRKYANWSNLTIRDFMTVIDKFKEYFFNYMGTAEHIMAEEYGMPKLFSQFGSVGIENLESFLRGITKTSVDMRRHPDEVEAACEKLNDFTGILAQVRANGMPKDAVFGFLVLMLDHNFLNPKQFERFYWPQLKEILDAAVELDTSVYLFSEGSLARFYDYFKDYPVGTIAIHPEQDDIYELRKALPNCTVIGGIPTELLGTGTPEECIAHVKKVCDDLGRNGGLILAENRMMSYLKDGKPENLKAVTEFCKNYRF